MSLSAGVEVEGELVGAILGPRLWPKRGRCGAWARIGVAEVAARRGKKKFVYRILLAVRLGDDDLKEA